ncbi:MAG: hypothetical protein ABSD32_21270 [Mycobacterium sp.]|jgi:cytochrome P450
MPTGSTPFGRVMHPPGSIHSLLIEEDPPQSLKWRQPLYPWFSPATVKRWHPKMVAYTTWFIDQKIETGAMDLVVDLTSALPTVITLTHLGVSVDRWGEYASAKPQEDHPCGIRRIYSGVRRYE